MSNDNENAQTLIDLERGAIERITKRIMLKAQSTQDLSAAIALRNKLADLLGERIESADPVLAPRTVFKVWGIFKLGTHASRRELRAALELKSISMTEDAHEIFKIMPLSEKDKRIRVILAKVKDFGFEDGASLQQLNERIREIDIRYSVCPAEIGPQVLLQLGEVFGDKAIYVVMNTVDVRQVPMVFCIEPSQRSLSARNVKPCHKLGPDCQVLFAVYG